MCTFDILSVILTISEREKLGMDRLHRELSFVRRAVHDDVNLLLLPSHSDSNSWT